MLHRDGVAARRRDAWPPPDGKPHFAPKAKSVIWIFLSGGVSHLETFDPKPALNKYAGKTFAETPLRRTRSSRRCSASARATSSAATASRTPKIFPLQVGFKKHGQSGIEVSDWLPHLATCVDDIAFVRSMYTTDNDHAAEIQMHTGRHTLDEQQPSIGSWVHYGLGTLNENLPQFVVPRPVQGHARQAGLRRRLPRPAARRRAAVARPEQPAAVRRPRAGRAAPRSRQNEFDFDRRAEPARRPSSIPTTSSCGPGSRRTSWPSACRRPCRRRSTSTAETAETQKLYGIDNPTTAVYGRRLLAARRLVERGVRFMQVYLSDYGEWDSHHELQENSRPRPARGSTSRSPGCSRT